MALIITTVSGCQENARNSETTAWAQTKTSVVAQFFLGGAAKSSTDPVKRERKKCAP